MRPDVDLDANRLQFGAESIALEPKEAELLHVLCRTYPRTAERDAIILGMRTYSLSEIEAKQEVAKALKRALKTIGDEV